MNYLVFDWLVVSLRSVGNIGYIHSYLGNIGDGMNNIDNNRLKSGNTNIT